MSSGPPDGRGQPTSMSLTEAIDRCDLPALIERYCGAEAVRGLGKTGGTICDPRPGMGERSASFSVWRGLGGAWMWKKRGRNSGGGTAFAFLLTLGMSGSEARKVLLEFSQVEDRGLDRTERAPAQRDILERAQEKWALTRPVTVSTFQNFQRELRPLRSDEDAAQELHRRGLWQAAGLQAYSLNGDLAFLVRGPQGRVYNVKRRRVVTQGSKYGVVFAGLGSPAWCSPGYGQTCQVLLIEGELNAAAAYHATRISGLSLDVQGLAGADTWPFPEGLEREVWIYADPDESGERMRGRLQDLCFRMGASRVRQVPALNAGDFCDLLGQEGAGAVGEVLRASGARKTEGQVLWPAEYESQQAARAAPLIGETNWTPGWPMKRGT